MKNSNRPHKQLPYQHFLHPYIFALREGKEIHSDFLDYSLLLLQVNQADIIRSPHHQPINLPVMLLVKK
jgi:hypothetical protein